MVIKALDDRALIPPSFSLVCTYCKHFDHNAYFDNQNIRKCSAFNNIPKVIWEGKNTHKQPYKGDRGIQFEPHPKARLPNHLK